MIAEQLAGKRIAITGGTGFLGTALIERLLRCVPGCELVLLIRPGPAVDRRAAGQARDLRQQRLRPPARASSARTASPQMVGRPGHADRRRRRHRRPRPRRRRPRRAGALRHRHPLGRHGVVRLAARRAPSRSTCSGPTRIVADAARPRRHAAPRRRCPPATWPATGAARRPRSPSHDSPFFVDVDWRARGRRRPPGPRRRRGRQPPPRRARALPQGGPRRARRRRHPRARRQDRAAPQRVGEGADGRGRPGPRRLARLARRLRLHQGARRAGAARRTAATCPVSIVRPSIIESALARAVPGLDPRLPHGRAGDHLLRPRPAEGVPRRARGHRRRHPGRPRGRRHHRRRRRGPRPTSPPSPRWRPAR